MRKLNAGVYDRLLAQAEEARDQGMTKLADGILGSIGATPEDERVEYSYTDMQDEVYRELWKAANQVIKYYDVNHVDAEKVHQVLESLASRLVNEVELSINATWIESPLEPKVPGEVD